MVAVKSIRFQIKETKNQESSCLENEVSPPKAAAALSSSRVSLKKKCQKLMKKKMSFCRLFVIPNPDTSIMTVVIFLQWVSMAWQFGKDVIEINERNESSAEGWERGSEMEGEERERENENLEIRRKKRREKRKQQKWKERRIEYTVFSALSTLLCSFVHLLFFLTKQIPPINIFACVNKPC